MTTGCTRSATYLWGTGVTTEVILNDDYAHTVEVDCDCIDEIEVETNGLQKKTVYAYEDTEYCVVVMLYASILERQKAKS